MGFYAPAQIVRDARDHGVEVRPVDVNLSDWDCTLERVETVPVDDADARPSPFLPARSRSFASAKAGETRDKLAPQGEGRKDDPPAPTRPPHPEEGPEVLSRRIGFTAPDDVIVSEDEAQSGEIASVAPGPCFALRLGFRQIKGLAEEHARRLVETRGPGYASPRDLWRRAGLASPALERLAQADAFGSMGLDRRAALWAIKGLGPEPLPLFAAAEARDDSTAPDRPESREPAVTLPAMPLGEQVANDYTSLRLSLKAHPLAFLRAALDREPGVGTTAMVRFPPERTVPLPMA